MIKIDIFSGFLGAGKTTLIKKLISEAFSGEKLVLIENEFGEIGIDGGFLKDSGVNITEMNSGCICCSLVGDFKESLKQVISKFSPDRILIEPSGVGKLSDVISAVKNLNMSDVSLNSFTTVADANKIKMHMKNFGEFYNNQIEFANSVILSRTADMNETKIAAAVSLIREKNSNATIITTDWDKISGKQILETMEHKNTLKAELKKLEEEEVCPVCVHHHEHDEHCDCGCQDHEHDHHHHEHDEHCDCGCQDHEHQHHHEHGHHHADDVFTSFGAETSNKYSLDEIESVLKELNHTDKYGNVLRAKGIVQGNDGEWIHFDFVPGEQNVRTGLAEVIGRVCVIGSAINEEEIRKLFRL